MKKITPRKHPPKLTISHEINDEDIWLICINGKVNRSCRKTLLQESFEKQNQDWDVKVLKRWIKGDGRNCEIIN